MMNQAIRFKVVCLSKMEIAQIFFLHVLLPQLSSALISGAGVLKFHAQRFAIAEPYMIPRVARRAEKPPKT